MRVAQAVLAILGLGITIYLSYERATGGEAACVIGGGCATVQSSKYAVLAGVPLAYMGVVTYAILLASAFIPRFPGRIIALIVAVCGVMFSMWLQYAELFLIKAICPWCVSSAIIMVISLGVAIGRILKAGDLKSDAAAASA